MHARPWIQRRLPFGNIFGPEVWQDALHHGDHRNDPADDAVVGSEAWDTRITDAQSIYKILATNVECLQSFGPDTA